MTAETIMNVIGWSCNGVGAAVIWITSRKIRKVRQTKEIHDVFKSMYEDVSNELEHTRIQREEMDCRINRFSDENNKLRLAINRLQKTLNKITRCPHYDACPIRDELQNGEGGNNDENEDGHDNEQVGHSGRRKTKTCGYTGRNSDVEDGYGRP